MRCWRIRGESAPLLSVILSDSQPSYQADEASLSHLGRFFHHMGYTYHHTRWQGVVAPAYQRALGIRERLTAHPERVDLQLSLGISLANFLMFLLQLVAREAQVKKLLEYMELRPRLREQVQRLQQALPRPQVQQLVELDRQLPSS
ncbi:MAG: hypothetical protein Q9P90_08215 [candidate division KSB1 bacterium]|nr:hypothetical protein [candidate division KSB1 bacterium]